MAGFCHLTQLCRGCRAPSATARAAASACTTMPPLVLRSPTNFAVSVVVQEVASREHTLTNKITPNFCYLSPSPDKSLEIDLLHSVIDLS